MSLGSALVRARNWVSDFLSPEPPDEPGERRGGRWARLVFRITLLVGSAAILGYAAQFSPLAFLRVTSLGFLLAVAGLLVGGLLGFLFGIPRTLQQASAPAPAGGAELEARTDGRDVDRPEYRGNTNLEQISDWLTKILVGVALTQFDDFLDFLRRAVGFLAPGFGRPAISRPFVLGLLLFFPTCGFLLGYLLTRLYLPLALRRSDIDLGGLGRAETDEQVNDLRQRIATTPISERRMESQEVAREALREQLRVLAEEYERLRATLPAGPERTRRMELVASQMRALAPVAYGLLDELMRSSSPGERLAAITFLQVRPQLDALDWLAERVTKEKPFVSYHAALALHYAVRALPRTAVLDAVERAKRMGGPAAYDAGVAKVLAEAERLLSGVRE